MPITTPYVDPLLIECPVCVQPAGKPCIDLRGNPELPRDEMETVHRPRFQKANRNSVACDLCGTMTGNLPRHRTACARKRGLAVLTSSPSTAQENLIIRAGSFAAADAVVPVDGQFRNGVTDLDMASLLAYLDAGGLVFPRASMDRWSAADKRGIVLPSGSRRSVSAVANEAIRLGLASVSSERTGPSTVRTLLVPAYVHLRSRFNRAMPACQRPAHSIKRYRLMDADRLDLVDCLLCTDIASI